jgi:hypothetical protein
MPYLNRDDKRAELLRWCETHGKGRKGCDIRHLLDLDREFPGVDMFGPQCIGVHCGQGWSRILRDAVAAIASAGGKIRQIKQKFGQLVIYWDPPDGIETDHELYLAAIDAVAKAAVLSLSTCEHCGETLRHSRTSSYQTLCAECIVSP